jgi:predicted MPP superfamily phosphohydrolase
MDRRKFLRLCTGAGALGLITSYPVFIERYLVAINHYCIPLPRLPAAFDGFTIVHLTDIHYGFLFPLAIVRSVIERANAIPCDLIVCTGDHVHETKSKGQIDTVWPHLVKLRARCGVLSVLGNHDHWADTGRSLWWLESSGQNLRHQVKAVTRGGARLWFAGAGDLWEDHRDLDPLLSQIPGDECRIVLAHNPDTADTGFSSSVDLFISGHTHGGQVNIPFVGAPVLPVSNKTYSSGLKRSGRGDPVFISRGIGWAIIPVRFNCLPEIAVITLSKTVQEDLKG